jgi:hypothetical protein
MRYKEGSDGRADLSSGHYLLGNKKDEFGFEIGFASCDLAHQTGGLVFGADNTLMATSGDGAE